MANIILLIDTESVSASYYNQIIKKIEVGGKGNVVVKRVYTQWGNEFTKDWLTHIEDHVLEPIKRYYPSVQEKSQHVHMTMAIDAMELMRRKNIDTLCIASKHGDFAPLAMHIVAKGMNIVLFGSENASEPLMKLYSVFIPLCEPKRSVVSVQEETKEEPKDIQADIINPLTSEIVKRVDHHGWADLSILCHDIRSTILPKIPSHGFESFESFIKKNADLFETKMIKTRMKIRLKLSKENEDAKESSPALPFYKRKLMPLIRANSSQRAN